jgi:phage terminase large subunit
MINPVQSTWASIYDPLLQLGKWRYKIYYGGRGGAKTEHFARALLSLSQQYKIKILCCREVQNSIEDSVYSVLIRIIETYSLNDFDIKKDRITNIHTGSVFIFKGLKKETVESIKSLDGVDICWVEEAHKVTHKSWKILTPTIRAEMSEIWISFNRELPNDPVWDRFCSMPDKNTLLVKVNWNDNPFFPDVLKEEKRLDYKRDPIEARHTWEGEPLIRSEALIFNGRWRVADFSVNGDVVYYHGIDWGFAKHPTVIIRCFINNNRLYMDAAAGKVKCDIGYETKELFDEVPTSSRWTSRADNARPESISHMRKFGFDIVPAKKGKGSIEDGIEHIKSFEEIIIHSSLDEVIKEFSTYCYKVDKMTEDILPEIVDENNHYIDALRYALEPLMRNQRSTRVKLKGF